MTHPASITTKYRDKMYKVTECDGEAHENGFIDNCMMCAPAWGWVVRELEPPFRKPNRSVVENVLKRPPVVSFIKEIESK